MSRPAIRRRVAFVLLVLALVAPGAAAGAAEVGLLPFLLKREDVLGFKPQHAFVPYDLRGWLDHLRYRGPEREEAEARLEEEGWSMGACQKLTARKGIGGEGTMVAEEFASPAGAKQEMRYRLQQDLAPEGIGRRVEVRQLRIHGVPKARELEFVEKGWPRAAEALLIEGQVLVAVHIEEPEGRAPAAVASAIVAIAARVEGGSS